MDARQRYAVGSGLLLALPPTRPVTTPTHAPALAFLILGGAAGSIGVYLLRTQPRSELSDREIR